jgi:CheY-like chemotaxis protein
MGRNTVLIIADRHPDPDLNTGFLSSSSLRVLTSDDGDAALETVRRERPGLVIEDLSKSAGTGASLCRRLKADPEVGGTPTIVVTSPEGLPTARETGADELLCKPLVPSDFYEAVRHYVPLPARRQRRRAVNLRFTFESRGRTIQAFSRDISLVGAFLKTDRDVPAGTHLDLTFVLPGDPVEIRCGARVRRIEDRSARLKDRGLGIEFEGIRDADLDRLEAYIARAEYKPSWFR